MEHNVLWCDNILDILCKR